MKRFEENKKTLKKKSMSVEAPILILVLICRFCTTFATLASMWTRSVLSFLFLMNVFSAGSYTHFDLCSICLTKVFGSDCTTTTIFLYILSVR